MIDELDSDTLIAEIVLTFDSGQPIVVVEGDLDEAFVSELALPGLSIVNARGKPRILEAIAGILALDIPLIVCVDRDFDFHLNTNLDHPDVVYTDAYNLEASLLLDKRVFRGVWQLNLRPSQRKSLSADEAYDYCLSAAVKLGELRLASVRHDLCLTMNSFPVERVMIKANEHIYGTLDVSRLVSIAICRSTGSPWLNRYNLVEGDGHVAACETLGELVGSLDYERDLDLVSGHDFSRLVNYLMSKVKRRVPSAGEIEWQGLHEAKKVRGLTLVERLRERASEKGIWGPESLASSVA